MENEMTTSELRELYAIRQRLADDVRFRESTKQRLRELSLKAAKLATSDNPTVETCGYRIHRKRLAVAIRWKSMFIRVTSERAADEAIREARAKNNKFWIDIERVESYGDSNTSQITSENRTKSKSRLTAGALSSKKDQKR